MDPVFLSSPMIKNSMTLGILADSTTYVKAWFHFSLALTWSTAVIRASLESSSANMSWPMYLS